MGKNNLEYEIIESYAPDSLRGKVIYIIITAARKISKIHILAENLKKSGAIVYIFATPNTLELIDNTPAKEIGNLQPIIKSSYSSTKSIPEEDLVVVAPCTFNTLSKMALGIADNYPLSIIQSAVARGKQIIVAPAYNEYWGHPLNLSYINTLKSWGVFVIFPAITSEKVSMISINKIMDNIVFSFSKVKFTSEKIASEYLANLRHNAIEKYLKSFQNIGLKQEKLNTNSSNHGCYSIKIDKDWALITSTGATLSELRPGNLTLIRIECNDNHILWCGEEQPSSESPMHIAIYLNSSFNAVIHSHSPKLTYHKNLEQFHTKEYVPYGDINALEDVLSLVNKGARFIILKYHGEIAIGESLDDAYSEIENVTHLADE